MSADARSRVSPGGAPAPDQTAAPAVPADAAFPVPLSPAECRAVLERVPFGHLAFARRSHVDAVPIRFVLEGAWLYFRASMHLRHDIASNPWTLISVVEVTDPTHFSNVVVRGACYPTEDTGSVASDAAAMHGIIRLRDPATAGVPHLPSIERRTQLVYRMYADTMDGQANFVPHG